MKKVIYIALALSIIAAVYFFVIQKYIMVKLFEKNLQRLLKVFSPEIVKNVERIYRLETAHFKSGQFKGTYSPGMEAFGEQYPYGWKTMNRDFWSQFPQYKPIGKKSFTEGGTGKKKEFLIFPTLFAAMITLADFLERHNNNPGRWYSLNKEAQTRYNKNIYNVSAKLTEKYA